MPPSTRRNFARRTQLALKLYQLIVVPSSGTVLAKLLCQLVLGRALNAIVAVDMQGGNCIVSVLVAPSSRTPLTHKLTHLILVLSSCARWTCSYLAWILLRRSNDALLTRNGFIHLTCCSSSKLSTSALSAVTQIVVRAACSASVRVVTTLWTQNAVLESNICILIRVSTTWTHLAVVRIVVMRGIAGRVIIVRSRTAGIAVG